MQRARNRMVAQFMATDRASHLLFIDADIAWEPEAVLGLLAHDQDVVCGVYPRKRYPLDYPFAAVPGATGPAARDAGSGLVEIAFGPAGFLCIKRAAFERLALAFPERHYRAEEPMAEAQRRWLFNFFAVEIVDGALLSEDYGFCRLWRGIGGRIWMDPAIRLVHFGQHGFVGPIAAR